jgi:hypothetical protein
VVRKRKRKVDLITNELLRVSTVGTESGDRIPTPFTNAFKFAADGEVGIPSMPCGKVNDEGVRAKTRSIAVRSVMFLTTTMRQIEAIRKE